MKRRVLPALLTSLTVIAVSLVFYLAVFHRNITGFFCIGDTLPGSPFLDRSNAYIFTNSSGYDGQMYLSIALDPLLRDPRTLSAIDNPRYRYRRILYPLLGYVLGLGRPSLIPWILVVLNLLCFTGIVALATVYLNSGPPGSWARPLLVLCIPGLWLSLVFSTVDLLAALLFMAALVGVSRNQRWQPPVFLCLACLTKESYAAAGLMLAGWAWFRHNRRQAISFLVAVLPLGVWLWLVTRMVREGTTGIRENFGLPLMGLVGKLLAIAHGGIGIKPIFELTSLTLLLLALIVLLDLIVRRWCDLNPLYLWGVPSLGILCIATMDILNANTNYLRVFLDTFLIAALAPAEHHRKPLRVLLFVFAGILSIASILSRLLRS